jgi:urease accessory protein UreF
VERSANEQVQEAIRASLKGDHSQSNKRLLDSARQPRPGFALPIVFACVLAAGAEMHDTGVAFAYLRLASTTSAALRFMQIGQTEAHQCLAQVLKPVPAVIDDMTMRLRPGSFAPAIDAMIAMFLGHRRRTRVN